MAWKLRAFYVALSLLDASAAIDPALDCGLRELALDFAVSRGPLAAALARETYDALQLGPACGAPPPPAPARRGSFATGVDLSDVPNTYFVDSSAGSDSSGDGSSARPFQTLPRGLAAARTGARPAALLLRGGPLPFYLSAPLVLEAGLDDGLSIAASPDSTATPTVSGAASLTGRLRWQLVSQGESTSTWSAPLPADVLADFSTLLVGGRRATLARFPNGNAETDLYPAGYVPAAQKWLPPNPPSRPEVDVDNSGFPSRPEAVFFPDFLLGQNGSVSAFDPPASFWAYSGSANKYGATYVVPGGLVMDAATLSPRFASWASDPGAPSSRLLTHHSGEWGSWIFDIASIDEPTMTIRFGAGGWQEARGEKDGAAFFVEGLLAELDAAGEFFVNRGARELFYVVNGTSPPPANETFEAPLLETLVSSRGTMAQPLRNLTIANISITGSAPGAMLPFEVPSGGDMSFRRAAAVVLEGTEDALIDGCSFLSSGGNALLLSGSNERATVRSTEFAWSGDSAIMTAGRAALFDATALDVPRNTLIDGCVMRETAVLVKQAGPLYSALTANTTFRRNVAFNTGRACVNVNDGAFGGHRIEENLLFGCVRETRDHGNINTWVRT
jgi:hypothetical protein